MSLSQRAHEGELFLDHRGSPGFTEKQSKSLGYEGLGVGSTLLKAPTKTCNHCGTVVIINPDRKRERAHCFHCSMYICDTCEAERHSPSYVHKTGRDKAEEIIRLNSISKGL